MPLGTEVGLGPYQILLDGDPALLPKRGGGRRKNPQFSAHVNCGQTVRWIKMPLGTEVGLASGHSVLDGTQPVPHRGTAPNFWRMSVVAKQLDASRCHLVGR